MSAPNGPARGSYTVTLRSGEPSLITQEALTLQLTDVHDSRCPIDALCIWEGHASVAVQVVQAGHAGETLQIGLPAPAEMKLPGEATYRGFRFSLQGLDPAPRAAVPVPLAQYRAVVRVERAE
ncbi:hypothetical protein [Aquabacterium sp.]|uniref:hypothetical protein n=1 Tax=Aquabacterium sp. TaxID=1872578 RepID=UPI002D7E6840|nr:hypothetical protein [Aquabacterium sp.]